MGCDQRGAARSARDRDHGHCAGGNARRGSDTYLALKDALENGGDRYIRFNYPELGVLVWQDDVMGEVTGIDEGEVSPDSNMEMTVTISINDVVSSATYVAP